jgi:hypothetical protein
MSKAASMKSLKGKDAGGVERHPRDLASRPAISGGQGQVLNLQRTIGNRAASKLLQSRVGGFPQHQNQSGARPSAGSASGSDQPKSDSHGSLLVRANADSGGPLDKNVRGPLEQNLGVNLGGVRVHSGPSSEAAAESLGARAYTIGSDIYLGPAARNLNPGERNQLLAHEAVHTVQQGGRPVALQGKLGVSHPRDSAEIEADRISKSVMSEAVSSTPSRALGLRDQIRATPVPLQAVSRVTAPLIQRDLKGPYDVKEGTFTLDLKTESHPSPDTARNGMSGTISFKANDKAPDSTEIKLLQVIRNEDLDTGKEYVWTGDDADRNKTMTAKDVSVEPGFHVDVFHTPGNPTPRTAKAAAPVSPYYRDYAPNPPTHNGSKKGKAVTEASLWDYPGSRGKRRFSFETVAKATDTQHVYGTVVWGFTISDAAKGTVEKERAVGRDVSLLTTDKAIEKFNEFYRNPGATTAPTK